MNQLLGNLTFDPEQGSLSLQAARYVMMSPALLVELQKNIEGHLPQEVAEIMTQTASGDGAFLASRYRDTFSYSAEEVARAVAYMLSQSGWGATSTEMVNLENQELVFKIVGSPFAEAYGPSTRPICYTVLGFLQGAAMTLFNKETDGMEVQCMAKGDACCRFVVSGRPG